MKTAILLLMVGLCSLSAMAAPEAYPEPLTKLSDEFMRSFFDFQPSAATRAGFHEYDARLESLTPERVAQQKKLYGEYLRRLWAMDTKGWSRWALDDREMLIAFIEAHTLELEMHAQWRENPDYYSSVMSDSTFLLMGRSFAPPEERLRSLVARERQRPRLLDEARKNLHNPPRAFTEIALEQLPGIEDFFSKDVPSAFAGVKDKKLLREFAESNASVVNALKAYESWMKRDLLPRSHGDFRLGAENFRRKLEVEEMVDIPLDR